MVRRREDGRGFTNQCVLMKDGTVRTTETSRGVTKSCCLAQSLDSHKNVAPLAWKHQSVTNDECYSTYARRRLEICGYAFSVWCVRQKRLIPLVHTMEFASVRLAGASPLHTSFLYLEPELLGNTAASTVGTSLLNLFTLTDLYRA